jgi:hypothetical protein
MATVQSALSINESRRISTHAANTANTSAQAPNHRSKMMVALRYRGRKVNGRELQSTRCMSTTTVWGMRVGFSATPTWTWDVGRAANCAQRRHYPRKETKMETKNRPSRPHPPHRRALRAQQQRYVGTRVWFSAAPTRTQDVGRQPPARMREGGTAR